MSEGRLVTTCTLATHIFVKKRIRAQQSTAGRTSGDTPISSRKDLASHPSLTMPLTFTYDNPKDVGGWVGGIEPNDESWIAFVSTDGKTFLWEKRESDGGVIGNPVSFWRRDLISSRIAASLRLKCETTPLGANAAGGRFRIFKEGKTVTDHGESIMTPEAGRAVIAAFEQRGNDMPIDLRHGMLAENPTLEQSEAYGWIKCPGGLEYVDGDGLYARKVEWDPRVRLGLQAKPPKWKYFSPTYDVDPKTRVVVGLTNVALTNLPATHGLNRLAAERGRQMDLAQCGKLLAMLMAKADAGDQEAAAMRDMLIAALGDQVEAALAAANDVAPESAEDPMLAGMSEDDKKVYAAMPESMKAMYKAGIKASKVAAEDDKAKVAAEKPEEVKVEEDKKSVAASISAEQLLAMADGELAKQVEPRQRIVAELVASKKIAKGGDVEKLLLDPSLSDETFTKVVAARKMVTVKMGAPPVPPAPTTKGNGVTVVAEQKVNKLASAFNVDPKAVLEKLRNQKR